MTDRTTYLAAIQSIYQRERERLQPDIDGWQQHVTGTGIASPLLGFLSPKWPLHLAVVAAFLYEQTKDATLAEEAYQLLVQYRLWATVAPADLIAERPEYSTGVPPIDTTFDPVIYAAACQRIRPALTAQQYDALGEIVGVSLRPIWRFPEWGGHNRAMLRAAGLAVSARAFPAHADNADWICMADELAEESWGRWSIEDAMLYQAHWLRALILYAEARDRQEELAELIQPRMHLRAMPQLITPLGILPDFGDSHWLMHSAWEWMACLEWGAAVYGDASMKWAAGRIWQAQQREPHDIYAAHVLTLAARWCDDGVVARPPGRTLDALDELVSKKIVFRTGWGENATYACLTYRDEGDYGRVARDYLRTNLAVSAEKMHHGHADEGSFVMLVHDETVLLHESGYRENPPDGIYRADFYHNRMIWRPGIALEQSAVAALRNNGHYRPVRADRLYLTHLHDVEIARVRIVDEHEGLGWDRTVFFLSEVPCWVVVDTALASRTAPRTLATLWWTAAVLAQGDGWVDTYIPNIGTWQNRTRAALQIVTPIVPGQEAIRQIEPGRRAFQDERLLSQVWRGHHQAGRPVNFVSVLWPHPYEQLSDAPKPQIDVVKGIPSERGLAVRVTWQGISHLCGAVNDLAGRYLQTDVRPRYSYEQGRVTYSEIATDADIVYVRRSDEGDRAGFINGTRLEQDGHLVYEVPEHSMFQEDGTFRPGITARFRWQGRL
jgi:hypothetical protein